MSLETDLVTALGDLVGGRIYPDAFPLAPLPQWPALRYTLNGGLVDDANCGSGNGETDDVAVIIDVVATTSTQRTTVRDQVRSALAAMTPAGVLTAAPRHMFDAETRTFRAVLDVTFYLSTPAA